MKTGLVLLSLALTATPAAAQRTRVVVVVPGMATQIIDDTVGTSYAVPYPPALVFKVLLTVYADLKLPTEVKDSAAFQIGSQMFYRQNSVAGKQISAYLSCGEGMTGPNADYYRVYMNIWSTITPEGKNGSTMRTAYLAGAMNVSEGSRQPMPCESTGRLELRLHQEVLKKLALGRW